MHIVTIQQGKGFPNPMNQKTVCCRWKGDPSAHETMLISLILGEEGAHHLKNISWSVSSSFHFLPFTYSKAKLITCANPPISRGLGAKAKSWHVTSLRGLVASWLEILLQMYLISRLLNKINPSKHLFFKKKNYVRVFVRGCMYMFWWMLSFTSQARKVPIYSYLLFPLSKVWQIIPAKLLCS